MKKFLFTILFILITSNAFAVDITYGTASEFADAGIEYVDMERISSDKLVVCYTDLEPGICRVATVSGTTPTWGTAVTFNADVLFDIRGGVAVARIGTDKFAVSYVGDGLADDGFTRAATVSTTTISYGTEKEFETTDPERWHGMGGLGTDKYVITYDDEANGDTCQTMVLTTSGTTITAGTPLECDGDGTIDYFPRETDTTAVGSDKWVSCFQSYDYPVANDRDGYCVVGTTSGTTITYDVDPLLFESGTTYHNEICTPYEQGGTADRFVNVFAQAASSVSAQPGTISTRTITYGTQEEGMQDGSEGDNPSCVFVSETQFVIAYTNDINGTPTGHSRLCEVDWASGGTITCGDAIEFYADNPSNQTTDMAKIRVVLLSGFGTSPKIAIAYTEQNDGADGMVIVGDVSFPTSFTPKVVIF